MHADDSRRNLADRTMTATEPVVRDALRQVIDPELGINIVDLGLVYGIEIDDDARVRVVMTMTSPACPLGDYLKDLVDSTIKRRIPGVKDVEIRLVWEPRWDADMMSAHAEQQLYGGSQ
jgi:metal-sulfur cluster biosynthetic enzyme